MADGERDKLASMQFLFDPTPLPKPMEWDHALKELASFKKRMGDVKDKEKTPTHITLTALLKQTPRPGLLSSRRAWGGSG